MVAASASSPRYEIVCRLTGGGMADLYLARLSGPGGFERLVVIKRLSRELSDDPAAMRALFDEARIAATLAHANIVQVHDVDVSDGQVSIVMEYLHGQDVAQLQRRLARMTETLPLDQALAIILGICAGLHHAHERLGPDGRSLQIVHRDVSPHNVFVTYDGSVKLVDFGIARAITRADRTEQSVIKGKPGFIAPEQLRGRSVDRRTDVWGASVLLYQMTTGRLPFGDGVTIDELVAMATQDPPPPSSHVTGYPAELEAIVLRGMSRDPAKRYPTAEAMRLELEAFARGRTADLSPFRLAALMERVFAVQLASWRSAQREGRSLADHVTALRASSAHAVVEAEPEPDPRSLAVTRADFERVAAGVDVPEVPRRRRRWGFALALIPALALVGIALWRMSGDAPPAAPAVATPAAAAVRPPPAPAPSAPVPPPEPAAVDPGPERIELAPLDLEPAKPAAAPKKRHAPVPHPSHPAPPATPNPDAPLPR